MTQEVRVTLILEVDATKSEGEIRQNLVDIFEYPDIGVYLTAIAELKEEAEIYKNVK